jgi:chromosome segregation ATPase
MQLRKDLDEKPISEDLIKEIEDLKKKLLENELDICRYKANASMAKNKANKLQKQLDTLKADTSAKSVRCHYHARCYHCYHAHCHACHVCQVGS